MKTMGHKIQTRIISGLLVFVMVFASIVSAGLVINGNLGDLFAALGFGKGSSGSNLALNTTAPDYDFITAGGSWGYEIDVTTDVMKLDGVRDSAYNSGVTIPAKYRVNGDGSFDVSFASDGQNIYVLYEVVKTNGIVYDANKKEKYHLDCADFILSLAAEERRGISKDAIGGEFRILGGIEGGVGTAATDHATTDALRAKGIQDWYVKHTDEGFNVEFTIPLSKVTGKVNGNKAISFTAVATIAKSTTSRVYPVAAKATGGEDKHIPSVLVVKGGDFVTNAGNYGYEVTKSATALALDGERDAAYTTNGVTIPTAYNIPASGTRFNVSLAADAEYAYVLYEFQKNEAIIADKNGGVNYKFDCADFIIGLTANEVNPNANKLDKEFRLGLDKDGNPAAQEFPFGAENYTVKRVGDGNNYNVEFRIPLSQITGKYQGQTAFTFFACSTVATAAKGDNDTNRCNPAFFNAAGTINKNRPSMLVISDGTTANVATGEIDYAKVDYTIDAGQRWGYLINEAEGRFVIDGLKDELYKSAVKIANGSLQNGKAIDPNNTYDLYVAADDEKVAILWEFADTNIVTNGHNLNADKTPNTSTYYNYYNDAAQFCLTLDGRANGGGGVTVDFGKAGVRAGTIAVDGYNVPYFVTKTDKGFNVEISFPRSIILNQNTFGFLGLSTIATNDNSRTYGFMANPHGSNNTSKQYVSQFQIIDNVYGESAYDVMADGRYKYTLEAVKETLINDGYKDPAYASGLTLQNKYNRDGKYHAENNYTLYLAADDTNVNMFFEVIDDYVVTQLGANGYWRNDCVHFAFNKTGAATKATDTHFRPDQGVGTRTYTHDGVTFTYTVVYSAKGYNVEVSIPRAQITNGNLFSFMPRVSLATSTTVNTYGFIENASKSAADGALNVLNQVEIVDLLGVDKYENASDLYTEFSAPVAGTTPVLNPANTPVSSANGYNQYNAYKSDITLDGFMDDNYANAAHFYANLGDNTGDATKYGTSFDAYVAYGSDGYIYLYADIYDDYINVPEELWPGTYWHTDLMQIYTWNTTKYKADNSNVDGTIVYQVSAPIDGMTNSYNAGTQPLAVERRLTENGWSFEAKIPYNGTLLAGGESLAIKFFYNDMTQYVENVGGNVKKDYYGYGKYTVTHSDKMYDVYHTVSTKAEWEATNRVVFNATSKAITNDASIFAKMFADPTKVAIVYPKEWSEGFLNLVKYPSLAVQTQVSNGYGLNPDYYASLAPLGNTTLNGAAVLEEGDPAIANYTYKVLVGHVNSYAETRAMIETIGYDKYGVGVFGNTVSVIGSTEQMLKKAVDTLKAELTGDLTAATLYYGTSPAVAGADLDWIADTRLVSDNGYGSYQIIRYKNAAYRDFETVSNGLLAKGYQLLASNVMDGKYYSRTFYNATDIITVGYGLHYANFMYVNQASNGGNNLTDANLDATANSLRISVSSRAVSNLPTVGIDEYEKVTDTVYVHATQDWDLCEIVRLENGEFIIFDAAHTVDAPAILQELYALSNGEKPVVAAWFITHFHQDHMGGLAEIGTKYADKITVKNVIQHMGSEHIQGTSYRYNGTKPSTNDKANVENFLPAIENLGANLVVSATGQVYNFANASVEILHTYADYMPYSIAADNTNRTNSIYSLNLRVGTVNQSFMITGDATTEAFNLATKRYGAAFLKSDFLQLAHHGSGEANDRCTTFYKTVDPSYIIIPRSFTTTVAYGASDQAAIDYVKAKYANTDAKVDDYIINACINTGKAAVTTEGDPALTVYSPQIRRLAIPYALGTSFEYPGVGATFAPEFTNTVAGTANADANIAANTDDRITMPEGTIENGSYLYVANTVYTNITTDGVMDNAYTYGIHLQGDKCDAGANKGGTSYDVYLVAGQDGKIHVFYEVIDNYYFINTTDDPKTWNSYRQDGADFWYGFTTPGTLQADVRIKAIEGAENQAKYNTETKLETLLKNDYAVVVKSLDGGAPVIGQPVKYTVEFSIDNNGKNFQNGDMMTFSPIVNNIYGWDEKEDGKHQSCNYMVDSALSSASGSYYNPNREPQQGKNNVLVFSTAPATAQAQRPANGSDNSICLPENVIDPVVEYMGAVDKGVNVNLVKDVTTNTYVTGNKPIFNAQAVYGIGTAYTDFINDGEMEAIYNYGLKLTSDYASVGENDPKTHGFEAYLVYGQDGKIHVFVEVTDSTMTKVNNQKIGYGFEAGNEANYWRRDSINMYFNFGADGTSSTTKEVWIGAVEGGDQSAYKTPAALPPVGDYYVKMTDTGYNIEFCLDRKGSDFRVGDYFEFGLYLNCASSEVDPEVGDNQKYSMTHSTYYIENYAKKYTDPNEYSYDAVKIITADSVTAGSTEVHGNIVTEVIAPTCYEDGYTKNTCTVCGTIYRTDIIPAGHKYNAVVTAPTCTADGYTTYTCSECGDSYVSDHVRHGHKFVAGIGDKGHTACSVCGHTVKINSASLALGENIAVNFNFKVEQLVDGAEISRVVFNFNDRDYDLEELPEVKGGQYAFQFDNLGPHQMGDTINATVYFMYNGVEYATKVQPYSILQYCNSQLGKAAASFKTVIVDMLNYGAAAQTQNNYKTNALVNAGLTAAQLAYGTPTNTIPTMKSCQDLHGNDGIAVWKSASLALGDTVKVKISVVLPGAPEDYKIVMKAAGKTWISGEGDLEDSEFTPHVNGGGRYDMTFGALNPAQMREPIDFTVVDAEGNVVSSVLTYSIETYVFNQVNKAATAYNMKNMLCALIRYGDSVKAWSGK